ncbi:GTP cyclohydrolase I FolE [Lactococcus petauri]
MSTPQEVLKKITATPWIDNGKTDEEKRIQIAFHFKEIMSTLGMDLTDDSLIETPKRVAKMFVDEVFYGLNPKNFPKVTCVENKMGYTGMVLEANITLNSNCEHHFVPIIGKAHIAYIPKGKVIGLSKLNRIVAYFGARPQIQERLTKQVMEMLQGLLETEDVAVVIDGIHTCVKTRGIKDGSSITRTPCLGGVFKEEGPLRAEFYSSIPKVNEINFN